MQPSNRDLLIDETAIKPMKAMVANKVRFQTLQQIMDYHREHTGSTLYMESDDGGGMYLTELPTTDLAVLEVRFGENYSIGLYSRHEAGAIADLILKALGIASPRLH